jgi:putative ABC transport system ATP-binding protein
MANIIQAKNLEKLYRTKVETIRALKNINFEIPTGDFIALMGHSGAGKTTLLNLIGCLDKPTSGDLILENKSLSSMKERDLIEFRRNSVGMIFQEFFLIESLTALENVSLPSLFVKDKNTKNRAEHLLDLVGLTKRKNHLPRELSGGEMQRVAIARALMNSPKIILADEPTGNLDRKNAINIFDILEKVNKEENITIVVATHNVKLAHRAHSIIHLDDGKILR